MSSQKIANDMDVLIINHHEVKRLLAMPACIAVLEQAFVTLTEGDAVQPLRSGVWLPDRSGLLGLMPGYLGGNIEMMGIKTVAVMPGNHGTDYDSHQGNVTLFEKEFGVMRAIVDASQITAIRTAGASGVATKLLARADAGDLALLGSGVQARTHLEAMLAVRTLRRVRVFSPHAERLQVFAAWAERAHGVTVEMMPDVPTAVAGADLICTTTSAREPILNGEWLTPGVHINAVGSSVAFTRELDSAAVAMSSLFVDWRESTVNEAGDYLFPLKEGAVTEDHIRGELGELLLQRVPGRQAADEITLFKSLGLAVEDIAAAHYVYEQALRQKAGQFVEIGSKKDA